MNDYELAQRVMENERARRGRAPARERKPQEPKPKQVQQPECFDGMTLRVCESVRLYLKQQRQAARERAAEAQREFLRKTA